MPKSLLADFIWGKADTHFLSAVHSEKLMSAKHSQKQCEKKPQKFVKAI